MARIWTKHLLLIILSGSLAIACVPSENEDAPPKNAPKPTTLIKKSNPLPPSVVAAWEKAGCASGWMTHYRLEGFLVFDKIRDEPGTFGTLPAFSLEEWESGMLENLPAPTTAFGLNLAHTRFFNSSISDLTRFKHLTYLKLGKTRITHAALKELSKLPNLASISFWQTRINDENLAELGKLQKLTTLNLNKTRITDAGLKEPGKLRKLTPLDLSWCEKITDQGLEDIARLPNLTLLSLAWCGNISDAGIKHIAQLKNLTSLSLIDTQITDVGLKEIAQLKQLVSLELGDTPNYRCRPKPSEPTPEANRYKFEPHTNHRCRLQGIGDASTPHLAELERHPHH